MGCWAVPTVAAEVWGVPLQTVLEAIENGSLLSRVDAGMVVVDVHPMGIGAARRRIDQRPPTFNIVTHEELTALQDSPDDTPDLPPPSSRHPALRQRRYFHTIRLHTARTRRSPCRKIESLRHRGHGIIEPLSH
jgi:hypothetical protein